LYSKLIKKHKICLRCAWDPPQAPLDHTSHIVTGFKSKKSFKKLLIKNSIQIYKKENEHEVCLTSTSSTLSLFSLDLNQKVIKKDFSSRTLFKIYKKNKICLRCAQGPPEAHLKHTFPILIGFKSKKSLKKLLIKNCIQNL